MKVLALSVNSVREIVHQKLLYNLLVFGVCFALLSLALGGLTIGQYERIILDVGLGAVGVVSAMLAILFGSGLISKEVERKTVYFVLSKPITRGQFIFGKWLGLLVIIALNAMALATLVFLILMSTGYQIPSGLGYAVGGIILEAMILSAIALCFSVWTTPVLAAIFTFAAFALGHLVGHVDAVSRHASPSLKLVGRIAQVVLPDLQLVNFKNAVDSAIPTWMDFFHAGVYAFGYSAVVIVIAVLVFRTRDLK